MEQGIRDDESEIYLDGDPERWYFKNSDDIRICTFTWKAHNERAHSPSAAVILVHGIGSHSRFEFLHHPVLSRMKVSTEQISSATEAYSVTYANSWVDKFNSCGIQVHAIDLQSHGMSEGWNGARCNVCRFDDFAEDLLLFLTHVEERPELVNKPIFLLGISLGGCIVCRAMQIGSERGSMRRVAGAILLAPALLLDKITSRTLNRILLPFANILSWCAPNLPTATKQPNTRFPFLDDLFELDKLCYHGKIRARIASETISAVKEAMNSASAIKDISVLICHSRADTMCDPEGAIQFANKLTVEDKKLYFVDEMWHFLTKEPGSDLLLNLITGWIYERGDTYIHKAKL